MSLDYYQPDCEEQHALDQGGEPCQRSQVAVRIGKVGRRGNRQKEDSKSAKADGYGEKDVAVAPGYLASLVVSVGQSGPPYAVRLFGSVSW